MSVDITVLLTFVSSLPDRYKIRNCIPKFLIIKTDSSVTCETKDQSVNKDTDPTKIVATIEGNCSAV
jgi:hypothetical protein